LVLCAHDDPYLGRKRTTFSDVLCSPWPENMAKAFRHCWNGNQNLVDEVTALHTREVHIPARQDLEVENNNGV
jgi:hypothetical protein